MFLIVEENSELKNRVFPIPPGVRKHLLNTLHNYKGDKTINGYKRLNNLLNSQTITYQELKRLKNFFDHYNGTDKSAEFILNGGKPLKNWVYNTLNTATAAIKNFKQAKKDAGIDNAFIKPHQKDRQTSPSKKLSISNFQNNDIAKNLLSNTTIRTEGKSYRRKILSEAAMDNFSLEDLSSIKTLKGRYKYCQKLCGDPIGRGSSRVVFQLDDYKVLKLALNQKGIVQNMEESRKYGYNSSIFPEIYETDSNYYWLVSEFVLKAKEEDFMVCMNIDFNDFCKFITSSLYYRFNKRMFYTPFTYKEYTDLCENNEDLNEWDTFIGDYNGEGVGDMFRICNYGLANREYGATIVLLDSGLSEEILQKYYQKIK